MPRPIHRLRTRRRQPAHFYRKARRYERRRRPQGSAAAVYPAWGCPGFPFGNRLRRYTEQRRKFLLCHPVFSAQFRNFFSDCRHFFQPPFFTNQRRFVVFKLYTFFQIESINQMEIRSRRKRIPACYVRIGKQKGGKHIERPETKAGSSNERPVDVIRAARARPGGWPRRPDTSPTFRARR